MIGVAALIRRPEGKHTFMLPAAIELVGGMNFAGTTIQTINHNLSGSGGFDRSRRRLGSTRGRYGAGRLRRPQLLELIRG